MELYTEVTFWERTEGTRRRVARRRVRDMVADEGVMKERENCEREMVLSVCGYA